MITPAESHQRAQRELHPSILYTAAEIGQVVGMHQTNVKRAVDRGRLESRDTDPLRCYGHQVLKWTESRAKKIQAGTGVLAVPRSGNAKLGKAAVTIVARQSCPDSCTFKAGGGCYADYDNNRVTWDRITAGAADVGPLALATAEADAIDLLPADRDLRLHVAGDSTTREGTQFIAAAAWRYMERARLNGLTVRVWAYTHAWREVPRECWGRVSVLASCETVADIAHARQLGYAAALVVPEFAGASTVTIDGEKVIPCPQQTRDRTCTDCRLCFDDSRLFDRGLSIGFALHGGGARKAVVALTRRRALPVVS